MPKCKVCSKTESETEFYKGVATYCKDHWKEKVRNNRSANSDYYKEFDRNRANLPHRIEARETYRKTIAFKESHIEANEKYRKSNPNKKYAQGAVSKAVIAGKIKRLPCFICGNEATEGHHPNYDSPIDVIWLCDKHHKETHVLAREIIRQESKRNDH